MSATAESEPPMGESQSADESMATATDSMINQDMSVNDNSTKELNLADVPQNSTDSEMNASSDVEAKQDSETTGVQPDSSLSESPQAHCSQTANTMCMETLDSLTASSLPSHSKNAPSSTFSPPYSQSPSSDESMIYESRTTDMISYPAVAQDLSALELTSNFDCDDLNEKSTCSPKNSANTDWKQTGPLCSTLKSADEANSPVPTPQLGDILLNPLLPGYKRTDMRHEDLGSPQVFMCGNLVTSPPWAVESEEQTCCSDNTNDCGDPVEQNNSIEDLSKNGSTNEAEIVICDEGSESDHQATSPSIISINECEIKVLPLKTKSTTQQVNIITPDIVIPEMSDRPKPPKFQKSSKPNIQFEKIDFSPLVIDFRPSKIGKKRKKAEQTTVSLAKKRKQVKDIPLDMEAGSSYPVENNLCESMKKGTTYGIGILLCVKYFEYFHRKR